MLNDFSECLRIMLKKKQGIREEKLKTQISKVKSQSHSLKLKTEARSKNQGIKNSNLKTTTQSSKLFIF